MTCSTSGRVSICALIAAWTSGEADSPVIIALTSRTMKIATIISSTPTEIDPIASQTGLPVTTVINTAMKAKLRPARAAISSPATTINSDWRDYRNQMKNGFPLAILRITFIASYKEKASSTTDTPSTPKATVTLLKGSGCWKCLMPSITENAPPRKNSSSATINAQKYTTLP